MPFTNVPANPDESEQNGTAEFTALADINTSEGLISTPQSLITNPQSPISTPQSKIQNPQSSIHLPSVIQFGLSLITTLGLWMVALLLALMGLLMLLDRSVRAVGGDPTSMFLAASAATFVGFLLLPSAWYALQRYKGRGKTTHIRLRRPVLLIALLPLALVLGHWVSANPTFSWFALPPLHILAVGLTVFVWLYLGIRGLSPGSPQRAWGVFGSGLVLAPMISLILEVIVLIGVATLATVYISGNPDLSAELNRLMTRLSHATRPEVVSRIITPYLQRPMVLFGIFAFGAVIVPMIEELIKPIGVWLLARRGISGEQGFVAGMLSGAGYALFENLAYSANPDGWSLVVLARLGTSLMHILTAGLCGWALALAWREKRYLRLGLTYLVAVSIHGLWNGATLLTATTALTLPEEALSGLVGQLEVAAPIVIVILVAGSIAFLLAANASFRRAVSGD